jgi:hypothetical protein
LTQDFFLHPLEHRTLAGVNRLKGKFRSFLLASFQNHLSDQVDSTGAFKTLIHRLRKRYTAQLREEVGRTVSDPAEIDEEIHALCKALITSEGRLGP